MPQPTPAFLVVSRTDTAPSMYPLTAQRHVIGRRPDAEIVVDHSSVSRSHAALELGPSGRWWLLDLESTNGTFVNGARVTERLLNPGDVLRIGDCTLVLRLASMPDFPSPLANTYGLPPAAPRSERTRTIDSMPMTHIGQFVSAEHLASVMALGRSLMRLEQPESRLIALCEFAVSEVSPAIGAAVARVSSEYESTALCGPFNRTTREIGMRIEPTIIRQLWQRRQSVLVGPSEARDLNPESFTPPDVTVILVPLAAFASTVDALYVEFPKRSSTAEWMTLLTLAAEAYQQAELVWQMRQQVRQSALVEGELEMACQIQERLVPRSFSISALELGIGFEPCRWVGGDYADAMSLPDGRVLLGIADVCGKGLQAALVASSIHTLVRASCELAKDLPGLMLRINDYLLGYLPEHSFVTMMCIAVDCETGDLEVVSAGHPGAIVIRGARELEVLQESENVGLGMIQTGFVSFQSRLDVGDVLLMYTDGLTEMVNSQGEPFGSERLAAEFCRLVSLNPTASVESMRRRLTDALNTYRGARTAADDRTFLVAARRSTRTMLPATTPSP
jgi:serine phosphatase RsbU (regulator of sigma subunit)